MAGVVTKLTGEQHLLYAAGRHGGRMQGLSDSARALREVAESILRDAEGWASTGGASVALRAQAQFAAQLAEELRGCASLLEERAGDERGLASEALAGVFPVAAGVASGP